MIFGYDVFELKKEHLLLLQETYMSWNYAEHGAPTIDPKRPYGNSSVYDDMMEILGIELDTDDERYSIYEVLTEEQSAQLDILHLELETAN